MLFCRSGSGKTTLLNLIGGLDSPTAGEISVGGNIISNYRESQLTNYRNYVAGFVFQESHLINRLTILDNIMISLELQGNHNQELVTKALERVGLLGLEDRYPNQLSAGQKQRVAIARALVKNPKIILADEPTGNLDPNTTRQIIELLKELSKERLVVVISHNIYDANKFADKILYLEEGKLAKTLTRNQEYSGEIEVVDDTIYLPTMQDFTEEEITYINTQLELGAVNKIRQRSDKFINSEQELLEPEPIPIRKRNLSNKDTFKLSYLFGRRHAVNFIISLIMAMALVTVFVLVQMLYFYHPSSLIKNEMKQVDNVYSIRKPGVETTLRL